MKTSRLLPVVAAMLAAASSVVAAAPPSSRAILRAGSPRMVRMPAGTYRPIYGTQSVAIAAFRLDKDPVTRGEYMAWKGASAVAAGGSRRPMTEVSWSEASAFCAASGRRLPRLAEWEYAAVEPPSRDLTATYARRSATPMPVDRGRTNARGIRGMHDLVWEWVADPNDRLAALHHTAMGHAHHHAKGHQSDMSCAGAAMGALRGVGGTNRKRPPEFERLFLIPANRLAAIAPA